MFEIKRTLKEKDIDCDFVALGLLSFDSGTHALFIINYKSVLYQYHFTGSIIELCDVEYDFFHKITSTIDPKLIPSFYAYCKRIEKTSKPKYGYFYSGEYYDKTGIHFAEKPVGERMTCVGFCLNVLKGFLEEDYILYQDWNSESHQFPNYVLSYAQKYNLKIEDLSESHRRITPLELITSAYFSDIPISKAKIDSKIGSVKDYIENCLDTEIH